jgi:Flp pilus assembly protein TadD
MNPSPPKSGTAAGPAAMAAVLVLCAMMGSTQSLASGLFSPASSRASPAKTTATQAAAIASTIAAQVRQALDERRYVDAGDLLDQAAARKIVSPLLTMLRGELFLVRERYDDALATFRAAAADPIPNAEALQGEGLALSHLGHSDQALTALQTATQHDKTLWRAWNALGREYDLRRQWPKAQAAYAAALAAPGVNMAIVLNNRGYSHLLQKELSAASADFVAALDKDPALSAARTNLRIVLALQGSYTRASSTGVGDDRAAVLNNVGLTAAMRGNYGQAEKLLTEAMSARGQYYARAAENLQLSRDMAARADDTPAGADGPH